MEKKASKPFLTRGGGYWSPDKDQELANCSFVKAILMLMVVLYHSLAFWTGEWFTIYEPAEEALPLLYIAKWLNSFHVYGFTLVSGYLFAYLHYERGKYREFKPFIISKTKRLLIPYVFISLVWVIPITVAFYRYGVKDILYKFGLGTSPGQLWFLLMLFAVFVFAWVFKDLLQRKWAGWIIGLAFYGIGIVGDYLLPNYFSIWNACTYFVFFILGVKLREIKKLPAPWLIILFDVLLFALDCFVGGLHGTAGQILKLGTSFLTHIAGALMAFTVLQFIAGKYEWKKSNVIQILVICSMPVYLLHQQIVYCSVAVFNGMINPYLMALLNFLIALSLSLLLSKLLMHFKLTKTLIGEK